MMKTNKTPLLYRVGKTILGPIFKLYYKPTIIFDSEIPNDSGVIIAGNHIHLYDQCHTIISVERGITYMAKKEYFDSKKTRWFFRGVGCIPVDRTKKDDHATGEALKVLKNKGIIGIFPEGTRNALKEERIVPIYEKYFKEIDYKEFKNKIFSNKPKISQIKYLEKLYLNNFIKYDEFKDNIYNVDDYIYKLYKDNRISEDDYIDSLLMDLKFGTVSMANKTDSYIIPVAVTGDYKFRSNNLIVRYGKPFKVENNDLEEANKKLAGEIKSLMKENLQYKLNNK